ncbi:MAG: TRAP transporter large permease subunit [Treponema sp.]
MNKSISLIVAILSALLILLPLGLFCITKIIPVLDSDMALIHIVFVFSCFAGILTEIHKKQLCVDAFLLKLSENTRRIIQQLNYGFSIFTLSVLFFSAFPNFFAIFSKDELIWYVPVRFIFLSLPLMYVFILGLNIVRSKNIYTILISLILSVLVSSSSIASIAYHLFQENASFIFIFNFFDFLASFVPSVAHAISIPLIFCAVVLAFLGLPLFVVISFITLVAFSSGEGYVDTISNEAYHILTNSGGGIAAIPLFTMAGYILSKGSAGSRFLEFVKNTIGHLKGGVVIATVLVITMFTTFTGASGISILALGGILSTVLVGFGYSKDDAESLITASGSVGILFPPSLAIIIYSTTNVMDVYFMDMFKGAILPGVLMALGMIVIGVKKGNVRGSVKSSYQKIPFDISLLFTSFLSCVFELLLPIFIVIFIFTGTFNLLETAAFTAFYAFCLETWIRKDFSFKDAINFIVESVPIAGGVLVIIAASKGLAYFLVDANVPDVLTQFVTSILPSEYFFSKYVFLFLLNILLLVVGCIMDIYSAILVVSPLVIPVAQSYAIDPVHTGVIFLTNLALGFLTPPIGMNLFIASYTFEKPVTKVVKSIMPYLVVQTIILLLVTYIPWFSLALIN